MKIIFIIAICLLVVTTIIIVWGAFTHWTFKCKKKDNYEKSKFKKGSQMDRVHKYAELTKISQKNGTPVFPRNGFLLGIIRHKGYLPNEGIDADLACLAKDVPKMLKSDWSPFEISVSYTGKLPKVWDRDFFDGKHPVTRKTFKYFEVNFKHKDGSFQDHVMCFFKYKPGFYYYPLWVQKQANSDMEYNLNANIYSKTGGGAKILLGEKELPLAKLHENASYRGKVGWLYRMKDFASFYLTPFYNTHIYVPIGSKNILQSNYGSDVLDVIITKKKGSARNEEKGNRIKLNSDNIKPMKF
jgi:hypothetical protein